MAITAAQETDRWPGPAGVADVLGVIALTAVVLVALWLA